MQRDCVFPEQPSLGNGQYWPRLPCPWPPSPSPSPALVLVFSSPIVIPGLHQRVFHDINSPAMPTMMVTTTSRTILLAHPAMSPSTWTSLRNGTRGLWSLWTPIYSRPCRVDYSEQVQEILAETQTKSALERPDLSTSQAYSLLPSAQSPPLTSYMLSMFSPGSRTGHKRNAKLKL